MDGPGSARPRDVTVRSGRVVLEDGREDHCFGPGTTFLRGCPGRPRTVRTEDAALDTLALPWAVVRAAARQVVPDSRRTVRFTGLAPADEARAALWRRTAELVRRSLLSRQAPVPPLVLGEAGRLLAATALEVFPHDGVARPLDPPKGTRPHLGHPQGPALQYAFARHAATTPLAYLRRVRLAPVHAELTAAAPADGGVTVTEVAARWGFTHAGRFAAAYRNAYGASPSQTLRSPSTADRGG
ncbi:helix-turn-helix domain-containing protein [Streptomyces sp. NPDC101206]|uniref:helix-turn-helix domain-containing protein n=1 Tax=Streptomyces sp. NPDC101206 TaxID=3366128 RepID=UPI0037F7A2F5